MVKDIRQQNAERRLRHAKWPGRKYSILSYIIVAIVITVVVCYSAYTLIY